MSNTRWVDHLVGLCVIAAILAAVLFAVRLLTSEPEVVNFSKDVTPGATYRIEVYKDGAGDVRILAIDVQDDGPLDADPSPGVITVRYRRTQGTRTREPVFTLIPDSEIRPINTVMNTLPDSLPSPFGPKRGWVSIDEVLGTFQHGSSATALPPEHETLGRAIVFKGDRPLPLIDTCTFRTLAVDDSGYRIALIERSDASAPDTVSVLVADDAISWPVFTRLTVPSLIRPDDLKWSSTALWILGRAENLVVLEEWRFDPSPQLLTSRRAAGCVSIVAVRENDVWCSGKKEELFGFLPASGDHNWFKAHASFTYAGTYSPSTDAVLVVTMGRYTSEYEIVSVHREKRRNETLYRNSAPILAIDASLDHRVIGGIEACEP